MKPSIKKIGQMINDPNDGWQKLKELNGEDACYWKRFGPWLVLVFYQGLAIRVYLDPKKEVVAEQGVLTEEDPVFADWDVAPKQLEGLKKRARRRKLKDFATEGVTALNSELLLELALTNRALVGAQNGSAIV